MNIVLIGLPSSGKTSVGKKLATKLNFDFIDIDDLISKIHKINKKENHNVQTIYQKYGKNYFREIEKRAIKKVKTFENCVIATGGGAIENKKNAEILRENNKIIFLDCNIDILLKRIENQPARPIFEKSNPSDLLKEISEKRTPLYKKLSDKTIDVSSNSIDEIVNNILEMIS